MRGRTQQIEKDALPEISPDNVDALEDLEIEQLKTLWRKHYGTTPPPQARKSLMVDCLAYRIQELAFGGLSLTNRKRLKKIAEDIRTGRQTALLTERRIKPGTRLVREWGTETHIVEALDEGFWYQGDRYATLSEIAGVITGSKWSGPLFFGLRRRGGEQAEGANRAS